MIILALVIPARGEDEKMASIKAVKLPKPQLSGNLSVEEAIAARRTVRSFSEKPLTLMQLSQILWSGQGITETRFNHRSAPSAGALYPALIYIVVRPGMVEKLDAGIYRYSPEGHYLQMTAEGDFTDKLRKVGYSQSFYAKAPVCFVLTGEYKKTTWKYGKRGMRYVHMEMGHIAQNMMLQVQTLKLAIGVAGAFRDERVSELLNLKEEETPFYLLPVGHRN